MTKHTQRALLIVTLLLATLITTPLVWASKLRKQQINYQTGIRQVHNMQQTALNAEVNLSRYKNIDRTLANNEETRRTIAITTAENIQNLLASGGAQNLQIRHDENILMLSLATRYQNLGRLLMEVWDRMPYFSFAKIDVRPATLRVDEDNVTAVLITKIPVIETKKDKGSTAGPKPTPKKR